MEMISAGAQFIQILRQDRALSDEISRLHVKLSMSRLLIERCEWWRFKFKVIDDLLPQLKDLECEAQTLHNEFTYQELKERVERPNRSFAGELISPSFANLRNWWTGYTTKVKMVHEKLDCVYGTLKAACDGNAIPEIPSQFSKIARPETSSFITEPEVFGRDKELNKVNHLLRIPPTLRKGNKTNNRTRAKREQGVNMPGSNTVRKNGKVSVLPIVGIGGMGKTTLAQIVCSSEEVKSHFDLIIWVSVSEDFDVLRLTKEIIGSTKKDCDINNLNSLQVTLKEMLERKMFLLVLDDVWSENGSDWHCLFGPLKEGIEGSMVIVTTRSLKVAEITGTKEMGPIILEGLENDVYWEFFKSIAFGSAIKSKNYPKLEEIGMQIVVKLKRSPLAAKTLGGLLSIDLNEKHWRNIRDSEIWELQQKENGILPVLQLSYQYLPSNLKKLFSFCSLFPKDYVFSEIGLIQFWVSQGFIDPKQNRQMEIVAKGYIQDLVSRCFFQRGSLTSHKEYVIHDLMHDVAQYVTKDECFRIEYVDFGKKISEDVRHLSVVRELVQDKLQDLSKYKKLHSLIIDHRYNTYGSNVIKSWFSEITNICSLSIPYCKINELPGSIGNLKHLLSLDISYTHIKQFPNSFWNLYKLELLNMRGCHYFQCFPEDSKKLISMKLLILPKGHDHMTNISLVGHIPNLANAINVENLIYDVNKEDNKIGALKHIMGISEMMRIRGLHNVSSKEEAEEGQLNNKEYVDSLYLCWSERSEKSSDSIKHEHQEEVLEGLCPHSNLKKLSINCFRGKRLPSWLKTQILTSLTTIYINNCSNITFIPCLPGSIVMLVIRRCDKLTSLQNCLVPNNLPALKEINISWCAELVSVPVDIFDGFICLDKLTIWACPKLACPTEMVLPPSLQTLWLESCGELEERFCSSLQKLTSLISLTIRHCLRLKSIPNHVTSHLKSLENMRVEYCSELQSLGGQTFFNSLKEIKIKECPKLLETEGQDKTRKKR